MICQVERSRDLIDSQKVVVLDCARPDIKMNFLDSLFFLIVSEIIFTVDINSSFEGLKLFG